LFFSLSWAAVNELTESRWLAEGEKVATGTDGKVGSGVYSVDPNGESYGLKTEEAMATLRKNGAVEKVWADLETEWKRITGVAAV